MSFLSATVKFAMLSALVAYGAHATGQFGTTDPLAKEWGLPLSRNLDLLPDEGHLDVKNYPWAETRFSLADGALLNRYQREDLTPEERSQKRSPNLAELQRLAKETRGNVISKLSPAEIFDLVRGLTLYPLTAEMRAILSESNRSPARVDYDEQMSFGWAAAATSFAEPGQVEDLPIRLPGGAEAKISIGSSDVKAIAAYYYGVKVSKLVKIAKIGARGQQIDAASFHILLANMIKSDHGRSFVADVDPSSTANYRPIVGYSSAIRLVNGHYNVTTTVEYAKRRAPNTKPYGLFNLDRDNVEYKYRLSVDDKHEITGGEWLSEERPEFVWRVKELPHVDHEGFSALKKIYSESPIL